jgi:hypothetical protein
MNSGMHRFVAAASLSLLLAACGSDSGSPAAAGGSAAFADLPATVEGWLEISVEEGDVGEDGVSDFNFGSLTVGGEELMVEVSGSLLSKARIPPEGAEVRAVLGSKSEQYGATSHKITELSRR